MPCIYVLAGANGAGKSSIGGAALLRNRAPYFNPDDATRKIRLANPGIGHDEANSAAWNEGKRLLERAIAKRWDFAFETTLGGKSLAPYGAGSRDLLMRPPSHPGLGEAHPGRRVAAVSSVTRAGSSVS